MTDPLKIWGAPYSGTLVLAGQVSTWVEVVRSGTFHGSTGNRRVELTEADILAMQANWTLTEGEGWFTGGAPVGFNHASAHGAMDAESTKAAARIREVEVRPSDSGGLSLWGLFAWTDEGSQRVQAGEFAAVSAELLPPAVATSKLTGEPIGGWTLIGATLTNTPFIPGMTPPRSSDTVAASEVLYLSDANHQETLKMSEANPTLIALAETAGVKEGELLSEMQRLQTEAAKVETLSAALDTATTDLDALRTRTAELEESEKTRLLDDACTVGRIAPTERDDYWALIQARGADRANALFAEGRIPVGDKTSEDANDADDSGDNAEDKFMALVDSKVAEGLSENAAWDAAKLALGDSLYN